MIQSNANVRFIAKHQTLGFRILHGVILAVPKYKVLAHREVERPPFYSDVIIDEEVVIFLRPSTDIGNSAINAFSTNVRVID